MKLLQRITKHSIFYDKSLPLLSKLLLIFELPFYPFVYLFLDYAVKNKPTRKWLYMRTKSFFPFKRISFYVLDKLFEKECNHFSKPSYDGNAGYILDLKYAIGYFSFNRSIYENNYTYSLKHLADIFTKGDIKNYRIIDFGCGAGVMTRLVKEQYKEAEVIGLDIRKEIMEYNNVLYPDIIWKDVGALNSLLKEEKQTILLCNGVINFMKEKELYELFNKEINYFIWFFYTPYENPEMVYKKSDSPVIEVTHNDIEYNMPLITNMYGYSFDFSLIKKNEGSGLFVSAISAKQG